MIEQDIWHPLKAFTNARIALGRTGTAIPLKEVLQFKLAFAYAKDAVYSAINVDELIKQLNVFKLPIYPLHSKAINREMYLQRPDLGRLLNAQSINVLKENKNEIWPN